MIMNTRIIVPTLLFCCLLLPSQPMRADITVGDYDSAISVAINNMVRHEKRFLSTSDIFDIDIYPTHNLLVVSARVDDEDHNDYFAIVSPKDTTVKSKYIPEQEKLVWVSPASKDTIMTCSDCYDWYSENYSLSFSPDDVLIDYSPSLTEKNPWPPGQPRATFYRNWRNWCRNWWAAAPTWGHPTKRS